MQNQFRLIAAPFTPFDLYDMQKCMKAGPGLEVFHGYDETLLCGLSLGVRSAVGSTYNYIPSVYRNVVDSFMAGDMERARQAQLQSVKLVDVLNRHGGGVRGGKAIMDIAGIACGECRIPVVPFLPEEYRELEKEIEELNMLDYATVSRPVRPGQVVNGRA